MNFEKLINQAKAIVFDLGGVILNIDADKTFDALMNLGFPDYRQGEKNQNAQKIFDDFERGKFSPAEFRSYLCNSANVSITDSQFDTAWNSMLLDIPPVRIEALMRATVKAPIFLLSNTNKIHLDNYSSKAQHNGIDHISDLFTKAYYSHEIGLRKPDHDIFAYLIAELNLQPNDILFLDDLEENIVSAKQAGISTIHVSNGVDIASLF